MRKVHVKATTVDKVYHNTVDIDEELLDAVATSSVATPREYVADQYRKLAGGVVADGGVIQFGHTGGDWVIFPASRLIEIEVTE